MRVRTHHIGALERPFFVTKNGCQGLAEEPLTLFSDGVRCPLFTAPFAIVALLWVLGDEREFVG